MKAVVTGSDGFIGRHMVEALTEEGYAVREIDLLRSDDCREFFARSFTHYDLAVHCAGFVNGREAIEQRAAFLGAYNLQLDGALFEWALRAKPGRIVYFSSSAMYPTKFQKAPYHGRLKEWYGSIAGEPDASYGLVKAVGERLASEVRKAGVPVTIVRPFSGYGEDQDDCYPFPAMIARAKRGDSPFAVWGNGRQVRDFIHVDDIVDAVLALVEQGVNGPVNLGTGVATSMNDLAALCMRVAGYEAPIEHLPAKPSGVQYRVADVTFMRRFYEPQVTLEEGVRRALA